jgi:hypothetical protein
LPPPHSSPHWLCWSFELVQLLPFWGTCLLTLDACQYIAMFFNVIIYFACGKRMCLFLKLILGEIPWAFDYILSRTL